MKATNSLQVFVPRQLDFRLHQENLRTAVVKEASAGILERLLGDEEPEDAAKLAHIVAVYLQVTGLNRDKEGGHGFTAFGNQLLADGSQHFDDALVATFQYGGFDASRRRIAHFQNEQLNTPRLTYEADRIVHEAQARLDREFTNIRLRQRVITALTQEVGRLQTNIGQASATNAQELAALERERESHRQQRTASTVAPSPHGWYQRLKRKLAQLAGRVHQTLAVIEGNDILHRIEEDLLGLHIRNITLAAEEQTTNEVLRKLKEESERNEQSLSLLASEAQAMRESARQAEWSRGWNVAAGELCLNSKEQTLAAVACLGSDSLWAQFTERYRQRHEHDIFIITGGEFNRQDIGEIEEIVREIVSPWLNWNVVDCLAACEQANPGYVPTILEAVRQVSARGFLDIGWDGFLRHNTFAVISYAQGKTSQANQAFARLVDDLKRVMDVEVMLCPDPYDQETLTIYIEDRAVPLAALRVYDEELYEAHDVRHTPSLTPHPEIHGIVKQTFPHDTHTGTRK
jgi:hypothetical protein